MLTQPGSVRDHCCFRLGDEILLLIGISGLVWRESRHPRTPNRLMVKRVFLQPLPARKLMMFVRACRNTFVILLIMLLCRPTGCRRGERRRPNIVWIVAENFCFDFGCYGAVNVRTPNVDALASAGLRYTNVFSTSPVCAPSRSCFMTGMYATTTDMHHMRSHRDDDYRLPPGVRPITQRLHDAGYMTANLNRSMTR